MIELTPGHSANTYAEYWKVWIDYNQDGDFDESNEEVASGSGSSAIQQLVNIPSGIQGTTRMRVAMRYNTFPSSSCVNISYGEVEDYTVTIGGSDFNEDALVQRLSKPALAMTLYPNPVSTKLSIEVSNAAQTGQLEIYDHVGRLIQSRNIAKNEQLIEILTSDFEAGLYTLRLQVGNEIPIVKRFVKN